MLKMMVAALLIAMSLTSAPSPVSARQHMSPAAQVEALLAADRDFAAASAGTKGLTAVGRMFARDVTIFAAPVPGFASGRSAAVAQLERAIGSASAVTEWTPIRAGISADGNHGFTFGYMTSREEGQPPKLGKYLSYWVKDKDGWHVRLFKRSPRPEGNMTGQMASLVPSRIVRAKSRSNPADASSLAAREKSFSDLSQEIGLGPAFARYGRPDAVNLGGGSEFLIGAAAIAATQPSVGSPVAWQADQGVLVAPSGDLGVTWGYLHRKGPIEPGRLAQIPFFTIWYREKPSAPWLYVAE